MAPRHKLPEQNSPRGDPELAGAGAFVKVIELASSKSTGENADKADKQMLRHSGKHHRSFPWSVRVPLAFSPRLRGLLLLNLVSCRRVVAGAYALIIAGPPATCRLPHVVVWRNTQQQTMPICFLLSIPLAGVPCLRIRICGTEGNAGECGPLCVLLRALRHCSSGVQPLYAQSHAG